ncbi:hypothetical protein OZX74_03940 [Bifidobacterium sp. ESL0798]|uniref:hypothetical protein n=1 Tax=Bifidobacterium sp. ESL0798 TaxID=2983235 RepID=UPI0023FA073F|nr:hypothetical protein [Bifidobacterium sp. ESL0798]WEV74678.1 hypothetical protein OZX74_03940 [Bifidobacterium sp. ESL0798]
MAEWLSCLLYARIILRGWPKGKRIVVLVAGLALLCPLQMFIGIVNIWWWLPCMALALLIMFVTLKLTCQTPVAETIYWLARSFTLAELAASLEWQLYTFFAHRYSIFRLLPVSLVFLFVIYAVVFVAAFLLEPRHGETHLDIDGRQLWIVITIAALTFALSNLSYISLQTPFSAEVGPQSFNIRTLVEIGVLPSCTPITGSFAKHIRNGNSTASATSSRRNTGNIRTPKTASKSSIGNTTTSNNRSRC